MKRIQFSENTFFLIKYRILSITPLQIQLFDIIFYVTYYEGVVRRHTNKYRAY